MIETAKSVPGAVASTDAMQEIYDVVPTFCLNMQRDIIGTDRRVRMAFAHALNRTDMVEKIYLGYGEVSEGSFVFAEKPWYEPNIYKYPYDPAKAEQLFDDAGHPRGTDGWRFEVTLVSDASLPIFPKWGNLFKGYLEQVGVKVNHLVLEKGAWLDRFVTRDFDVTFWDVAVGPAPFLGASRLMTEDAMLYQGFRNTAWYLNQTVDNLWKQYIAETDMQKRYDILKDIQRGFTYDAAYIVMAEKPVFKVWNNDKFPTINRFPEGSGIPAEWFTEMGTIWWSGGSAPEQEPPYMLLIGIVVVCIIAIVAVLVYLRVKR
jgi:ABC-type transport system substrate-binding protein